LVLVRTFGSTARRIDTQPALFLDRDGILNRRLSDGYVLDPDELVMLDGIVPLLAEAMSLGTPIVVVSNQGCISRALLTEETLDAIHRLLLRHLAGAGVTVEAIYVCPHHPAAVDPADRSCDCRKPLPGLLLAAARDLALDLSRSLFIGDQESDRQAAEAAGITGERFLLVDGEDVTAGLAGEFHRLLLRLRAPT
jgi:D-glycero-D-manno-heptose 1,7-bisphosphate phosphatase